MTAAEEQAPRSGAHPVPGISDLHMAAAALRQDMAEIDAFLTVIVHQLRHVSGVQLHVRYSEGWFKRLVGDLPFLNHIHSSKSRIRELSLTLGGATYEAHVGQGLRCTVQRPAGGAAGTGTGTGTGGMPEAAREVTMAEWSAELLTALAGFAGLSAGARQALEDVVYNGHAGRELPHQSGE